jgi:hypothetical protein
MAPSLYRLRKAAAPLAWLLASLLLLLPMGWHAAGVVLCIESDGHVSVEHASGAFCSTLAVEHPASAASSHGLRGAATDAAAHCVDCIDLPVPRGADADCASFRMERSPAPQVDLPLAAVPPHLEREAPPAAYVPLISPTASDAVSDRTPLRSVVLLI